MHRWLPLFLVVLALGGFIAWKFRAPLATRLVSPSPAESQPQKPDVLYSWVDKEGVTHFAQQAGRNATRLEYDGSRITPLETPAETVAMGSVSAAPSAALVETPPPPPHPTALPEDHRPQRGSRLLHDVRREMEETQRRMHEHRQQQSPDL